MSRSGWRSASEAVSVRRLIVWVSGLFLAFSAALVLATPAMSQPRFAVEGARVGDWLNVDSQDRYVEEEKVDALELARIEDRLKLRGWSLLEAPAWPVPVGGWLSADERLVVDERDALLKRVPNGAPLNNAVRISSPFGDRLHPLLKKRRPHKGIDFSVSSGTPVHTTANGIVVVAESGTRSAYGKHVIVRHALGFTTLYAHLQEVKVKPGEFVRRGGLLGRSGNTGTSTAPHLHYEVRYREQAVNPEHFVRWSRTNYQAIFRQVPSVPWSALLKHDTVLSQAQSPSGATKL